MCCNVQSADTFSSGKPVQNYADEAKADRKRTITLLVVAILFLAATCICFGLSTLPPDKMQGLGFLYTLAGYSIGLVGCEIAIASAFYAVAACRNHKYASRIAS